MRLMCEIFRSPKHRNRRNKHVSAGTDRIYLSVLCCVDELKCRNCIFLCRYHCIFGMTTVCVVCRYHPTECFSETSLEERGKSEEGGDDGVLLDDISKRNDEWDDFNHPRRRRALILRELYQRQCHGTTTTTTTTATTALSPPRNKNDTQESNETKILFETTGPNECDHDEEDVKKVLDLYRKVHSSGLMEFLSTAWEKWEAMGPTGRDPSCVPFAALLLDDESDSSKANNHRIIPPLIPCNFSFPRDNNNIANHHPQRSSKNVMGQIGYYCTDTCTPIVSQLVQELTNDSRTVSKAVDIAIDRSRYSSSSSSNNDHQDCHNDNSAVVYALSTHPGHHASFDSFGGYCYVNNAALAARLLQERLSSSSSSSSATTTDYCYDSTTTTTTTTTTPKIAILDVDYHCGNGTASIFYNDPTVLVVSIHCHPDFEYPFHSGFGDETGGTPDAEGCTLHLPLLPGASWEPEYRTALVDAAGDAIAAFGPDALVLSLGLDTHIHDPCSTRRAGFKLRGRVNVVPTTTEDDGSKDNDKSHSGSSSGETDYDCMGRAIGEIVVKCSSGGNNSKNTFEKTTGTIPTVVLQEGGYEMTAVPSAAADVLLGMATAMSGGGC